MATAWFNQLAQESLPEKADKLAFFDCRVWNVPNRVEATNTVLWRERDATKNSISMAAREYYSHKETLGKSGTDLQEMLFQKGMNWNDYPAFFKRGTFIQRRIVTHKMTCEDLEKLPEKHQARRNPELEIERSDIRVLEMPSFGSVTNRVEVIFEGEDPLQASEGKEAPYFGHTHVYFG